MFCASVFYTMLPRKRSEGLWEKPLLLQGVPTGIGGHACAGGQFFSVGGRPRRRQLSINRGNDERDGQGAKSVIGGDGQAVTSSFKPEVTDRSVDRHGGTTSPSLVGHGTDGKSSLSIVIHVCDEAKRIRRDFLCDQNLLLTHMKYFESYLAGVSNSNDVDISVHCDVGVFEWLVEYMRNPSKVDSLDTGTVVSILISSHFLQMERLVSECLAFMKKCINEVLRLPIDLSCLSDDLVRQLTSFFSDEDLELVRDRRDRLVSRLYAHKLEELWGEEQNKLHRCTSCHCLFTSKQKEYTACPNAESFIDFHGNAIAQHVADTDWDISCFVQHCQEHLQLPWREIYWRAWGHVQTLRCTYCHAYFSASELGHCSFHPEKLEWQKAPRAHVGVYPCCQHSVLRFGNTIRRTGCCARDHVVEGAEAITLEKLLKYKTMICVPFQERHKGTFPSMVPGRGGEENIQMNGAAGDYEDQSGDDEDENSNNDYDGDAPTGYVSQNTTWGDHGSSAPTWNYCFDPPPEHCQLRHEWKGSRSHSPGHSRFGCASRRSRSSEHCSRPNTAASKDCKKASHRRQKSITSMNTRELSNMRDADTDDIQRNASPPPPSASLRELGGTPWPAPAPAASPSFFRLSFPPGVSGHRRHDYQIDMLREDDRRRMDELSKRIRSRNNEVQLSDKHSDKRSQRSKAGRVGKTARQTDNLHCPGEFATSSSSAKASPSSLSSGLRRKGNKPFF